jgi:microcystin-dependent protein
MAISNKHKFTSPKADGADTSLVRPSNWNDEHDLTMATGKVLGRTTAGDGAVEELTGEQVAALVQPHITTPDAIPSGVILLWSGSVASIPSGWLLCNGTSGTPDLRDRFVVGAGSAYAVGATGGAASVTLTESQIPSHTHTGSAASAGAHAHTVPSGNGGGGGAARTDTALAGALGTTTDGAHSHTLSINNTGGGGSHENLPPYYALCYIMKA